MFPPGIDTHLSVRPMPAAKLKAPSVVKQDALSPSNGVPLLLALPLLADRDCLLDIIESNPLTEVSKGILSDGR